MEQITFLTLTAAVQNHYISSPQQSSMSLQHHSSSIPCHELLTCTRTLKGFLFGGVFSSFSWPRLYQEHTENPWDVPWVVPVSGMDGAEPQVQHSQNSWSVAARLKFLTSTAVISQSCTFPSCAGKPRIQRWEAGAAHPRGLPGHSSKRKHHHSMDSLAQESLNTEQSCYYSLTQHHWSVAAWGGFSKPGIFDLRCKYAPVPQLFTTTGVSQHVLTVTI